MIDAFTFKTFIYLGLAWLFVGSSIVAVLAIRDCVRMLKSNDVDK